VNCQLLEREILIGGEVVELELAHAPSIKVAMIRVAASKRRIARTPGNRDAAARIVPQVAGSFVAAVFLLNVFITFYVLEAELKAKLYGSRPVCIERMQKRRSGYAIGSSAPETSGVQRAGIATDDIVSTAARVIRVVDPELSVIENVEGLGPELELS
jgi:hypothetical protein